MLYQLNLVSSKLTLKLNRKKSIYIEKNNEKLKENYSNIVSESKTVESFNLYKIQILRDAGLEIGRSLSSNNAAL